MKKTNSKLFKTDAIASRMELSNIYGGATSNKSDVTYNDTKLENGKWDITVLSLLDIEETKVAQDKPSKIMDIDN